jgi:iron complex outermembrane receptor protein
MKKIVLRQLLVGVATLALAEVLAEPAMAQVEAAPLAPAAPDGSQPADGGAPQAGSGGLEEIVVTAQRRSENLQRTPISVTAVNAEQLARWGNRRCR